MHFLPPLAVSLVTSERGPGWCERRLSQIQNLETVQLLFLPSLRCEVRKWELLWLGACALTSAVYPWAIPEAYSSVRKQSKRQCGPRQGWRKQKSSRTPGAVSSHVPLTKTIAQSLPTKPQRYSSMYMSIISVSWERCV